jgi:hypothetical protein
MGIFGSFGDRNKAAPQVPPGAEANAAEGTPKGPEISDQPDTDSSRLSLEARNEKEIQQHPDQVTADAHLGVQKVEAAALVWSKKAVWATYAW